MLAALPGYAMAPESIQVLPDAKAYRACLFERIRTATRRIVIVALYLQEDEAGQEVLDALYQAKAARPGLEITIVVDWFRARRGLLGVGVSRATLPGTRLSASCAGWISPFMGCRCRLASCSGCCT
jgi:CDP-diacylglycerol--serine O-phosphatidyltransferase